MKSIAISASARAELGSKESAQIRKEERVPGVLYGGDAVKHFSIKRLDLRQLTRTTSTFIVELDIDGQKSNALLKEVQYHPVTDAPLHVDFLELKEGAKANVKLSIKLVGQSQGVRIGGKLSQPLRKVTVAGVPAELPEQVEVDITPLKVGDSIRIRDIDLKGGEILGRSDSVVCAVKTARTVVEETPEDATAEEGAAAEGAEAPASEG